MANDIGWGEGACNNDIGWGLAQEYFSCSGAGADAIIENSDQTYLTTTPAGSTLTIPDIILTEGDETNTTYPAAVNLSCKPFPIGAKLMKSGQTTSYRTGDDGDIEAGRETNFTTLFRRNPFGNTNRFTSELGTQTYTNNIVIDWSTYDGATVLGYKRTATNVTSGGWNNAIDTCLAISIGTFTSGWRLANVNEWNNIMNRELTNVISYAPFNTFTFTYTQSHTSTTYKSATSAYSWGVNSLGIITAKDKTENSSCLAVRTFTVTGTTLT